MKNSGSGILSMLLGIIIEFLLSVVLACCLWLFAWLGFAVRQSFGQWPRFFGNLLLLGGVMTGTWYFFADPTNIWFTCMLGIFNMATLLGITDMDFLDGTLKLTNDTRAASVVGYFGIGRIVFCMMCIGLVAYRLYNPAFPMFAQ
jgi:hypothetical protein